MIHLVLTFLAAAGTDWALLWWNRMGQGGFPVRAGLSSLVVAALSLAGLSGALDGTSGVLAYLAGNFTGSWLYARFHKSPAT